MWIVKSGEIAYNLDICDSFMVCENRLVFTYEKDENNRRDFKYESKEHAKQDFHHIINALKRKEHVLYL